MTPKASNPPTVSAKYREYIIGKTIMILITSKTPATIFFTMAFLHHVSSTRYTIAENAGIMNKKDAPDKAKPVSNASNEFIKIPTMIRETLIPSFEVNL